MSAISLPVKVTVKSVPTDYTPPNDMQGLLEEIAQYTDYEMTDDGPAISVSSTAPAGTNGTWIKIVSGGARILSFYNGAWREIYTGKPNEVKIFVGYPASYFDGAGLGHVGGDWDGWALCNGNHGTINLQSHFVVPGYRWDSGGWVTNIGSELDQGGPGILGGGGVSNWSDVNAMTNKYNFKQNMDLYHGGFIKFQIAYQSLPEISILFNEGPNFNTHSAGGAHMTGPPPLPWSTVGTWHYNLNNAHQMTSTPIDRLPPYIAVGYTQFLGYT